MESPALVFFATFCATVLQSTFGTICTYVANLNLNHIESFSHYLPTYTYQTSVHKFFDIFPNVSTSKVTRSVRSPHQKKTPRNFQCR